MTKRLTYIDSCVLIHAWRAEDETLRNQARAILSDAGREFAGCKMIDLEVVPKPWYHERHPEQTFMRNFCHSTHVKVDINEELIESAMKLAGRHGLAGADAIHVAAADKAGAAEFVTSEKETHAFYRIEMFEVTHTLKVSILAW